MTSHKHVVFLGQNPSRKNPKQAFVGTASGNRLWKLIHACRLTNVSFENVFSFLAPEGRDLPSIGIFEINKVKALYSPDRVIVACGSVAKRACEYAGVPHVHIPHPSGLNREWNKQETFNRCIVLITDAVRR